MNNTHQLEIITCSFFHEELKYSTFYVIIIVYQNIASHCQTHIDVDCMYVVWLLSFQSNSPAISCKASNVNLKIIVFHTLIDCYNHSYSLQHNNLTRKELVTTISVQAALGSTAVNLIRTRRNLLQNLVGHVQAYTNKYEDPMHTIMLLCSSTP